MAFGAIDGGSNPPGTILCERSEHDSRNEDSSPEAEQSEDSRFESARDYFAPNTPVRRKYPQRFEPRGRAK